MRNDTRQKFNGYRERIETLNGVDDATTLFTVDPSVQQKLETRMQESSDFLGQVNVIGVDELMGEKVGVTVTSTVAGRTDTSAADRPTQDPTGLDKQGYLLAQTNFDTHLSYSKLDTWAKFPDFETRIRDAVLRRQALDRIMIGFNGTSIAASTNRVNNPLLQDVNKGWLQQMRENASARVMSDGADTEAGFTGKVTYGAAATADYKTLDALVYDVKHELLPAWAREDTELVAIVGQALLHDKYFPLVNAERDPSEQLARDVIMSTKRLGGLPAAVVPFFPATSILITRLDNLSIYFQNDKRRRAIIDNPKRNRVENFESSNEGYVVEDYDYAALVENIAENN